MKPDFKNIGLILLTTLVFISCNDNDENETEIPTAAAFEKLRTDALEGIKQKFTLTAENGITTLTSEKGVKIKIDGTCLTKNGNAVTGTVDIEFIEIFDGGTMLATNKTTMGKQLDGSMALIISGGEFFIQASQNGTLLDTNCLIELEAPANLTGGGDSNMLLWNGTIDDAGNLDWEEEKEAGGDDRGVFEQGGTYYAFFDNFGWTNVDKFYNDPRPKTTIQATAPTGYNYQNAAIYLHYDGEGNALAKLDTYNAGVFSEHYGQIPIGLECHIIFATEDNGNWRYAIKEVTITAGTTYNFTLSETILGTEAQMIAAINALP